MFAKDLGSNIHSHLIVFSADMLDTATLLSINYRILVHQFLLLERNLRCVGKQSFVNLINYLSMHALHASAASHSFGVPSTADFAPVRSSTFSVNHVFVEILC